MKEQQTKAELKFPTKVIRFIEENFPDVCKKKEIVFTDLVNIAHAYATQPTSPVSDEKIKKKYPIYPNPKNVFERQDNFRNSAKQEAYREALRDLPQKSQERESKQKTVKPVCTKPDCDCLEQAEEKEGGGVKQYPCLMSGAIRMWEMENEEY